MRTEARYEELRPLLFSIAYRMVSSVSEAEDIVQEAFLCIHRAEAGGEARRTARPHFVDREGRIGAVMSLEIAEGVIQTIRGITNPDKLAHLGPVADVRAILQQGRTERSAAGAKPG
jgi:hypothetical protein